MRSTQFVLVTPRQTVVAVESARRCLQHAALDKSSLNFCLTSPSGLPDSLHASHFDLFGATCLLRQASDGWVLSNGSAFASAEPDGVIDWTSREVKADHLFHLVPTDNALLLSPFADPTDRRPPSDGRRRLLMIVPWLTIGGTDKVNLDLVIGLKLDFDITLVTTVGAGAWTVRFEPHVTRIIHLAQILPSDSHPVALARLVTRLGIDCVLLSNTREGYAAVATLRPQFPDLPIFDVLHGQGGNREGGGYPAISAPFDRYLTGRVVITDYLRNRMTETHGISSDRITRIYNGVDVDYFTPAKSAASAHPVPVVTYVGRLSYEKHPEHVVTIAQALPSTSPCRFKIAGDGPMMGTLAQMLVNGVPPHPVDLLGYVDDVRELLAQTDVLILTSEMEGFPIVVLEAMAMGIPVICPAVGGIPELVRHDRDGFLVPYGPDFTTQAAGFLQRLLADADLRLAMGSSARARVEAEFSVAGMMARYRALLASPEQPPARNPIERGYKGAFYVQKLKVREVAHRLPFFKSLCSGRRVLHVGCTDFPVFDPTRNLHIQLKGDCAILDGLDVDVTGMAVLSEHVPGRYFANASEVTTSYDFLLVPETIEHVHNIREFLMELDTIHFQEILITAPCLIGWHDCFNYADRPGRLSAVLTEPDDYIEEVHPDHKAWFTPYTLANCVEQFTSWRVGEVLFLEGKRMTAVHCYKGSLG